MRSEQNTRDMALLALAASNTTTTNECPSEETLAYYIDGVVNTKMKRDITTHLNHCAHCRERWIEVSENIMNVENECLSINKRPLFKHFINSLQDYLSQIPLPVTAIALSVSVLMFVIPKTPSVTDRLDSSYATFGLQLNNPDFYNLKTHQTSIPLPWENTSLAFNQTRPNEAQRALGAGLWQSQLELGLTDSTSQQNPFPSSNSCCWEKTQWADFYQMGRWLGLLWWQTLFIKQSELSHHKIDSDFNATINWTEHSKILTSLQQKLDHSTVRQHPSKFVAELEQMSQQLATPVDANALHRHVLHTIHRLGPTTL